MVHPLLVVGWDRICCWDSQYLRPHNNCYAPTIIQTYDTPSSHRYINLSLFLKWFIYIMYIVVFYSYLLKLTEWLMLAISGIESTTCFKNMPMQRTIPENITAAKAIVKIVIIIINLFKIYYLLFLKCECKVNTFLSNNGIFCREISLQYVFLDMGQPLVFSL